MRTGREKITESVGARGAGRAHGRHDKDGRDPMTESSGGYCSGFKNVGGHSDYGPRPDADSESDNSDNNTIFVQGFGEGGVHRSSGGIL